MVLQRWLQLWSGKSKCMHTTPIDKQDGQLSRDPFERQAALAAFWGASFAAKPSDAAARETLLQDFGKSIVKRADPTTR